MPVCGVYYTFRLLHAPAIGRFVLHAVQKSVAHGLRAEFDGKEKRGPDFFNREEEGK
jgi:hypothetical protein